MTFGAARPPSGPPAVVLGGRGFVDVQPWGLVFQVSTSCPYPPVGEPKSTPPLTIWQPVVPGHVELKSEHFGVRTCAILGCQPLADNISPTTVPERSAAILCCSHAVSPYWPFYNESSLLRLPS